MFCLLFWAFMALALPFLAGSSATAPIFSFANVLFEGTDQLLTIWQTADSLQGQFMGTDRPFVLSQPVGDITELEVQSVQSIFIAAFTDSKRLMYLLGNGSHTLAVQQLSTKPSISSFRPKVRSISLPLGFEVWWLEDGILRGRRISPGPNVISLVAPTVPSSLSTYAVSSDKVDRSPTIAWPVVGTKYLQLYNSAMGSAQLQLDILPDASLGDSLVVVDLLDGNVVGVIWSLHRGPGCLEGCVWIHGHRWDGGQLARIVIHSNVTSSIYAVPCNSGFAVMWLQNGSSLHQVSLSESFELLRDNTVALRTPILSFHVAQLGTSGVTVGGLTSVTEGQAASFATTSLDIGSPVLQSMVLDFLTPTPTPIPTLADTATPTPPPADLYPTSLSPFLLESSVAVLSGLTVGTAMDPLIVPLGAGTLLLSWRLSKVQTAVIQGRLLDEAGQFQSPALTLVLLRWGGSAFSIVPFPSLGSFAVVYVDIIDGISRVYCQLFTSSGGAALSEPLPLSSQTDPLSSSGPHSASAALLRSDTLVAVWWTTEAMHMTTVTIAPTATLQQGPTYHLAQEISPPLGQSYSPVHGLNDHLFVVTWRGGPSTKAPRAALRGGCFYVSASSITQTSSLSISDNPSPGSGPAAILVLQSNFIIAWSETTPVCQECVYLQRYSVTDGALLGSKRMVGRSPFGSQSQSVTISALSSGLLMISWLGSRAKGCTLYGHLYDNFQPKSTDPALLLDLDQCAAVNVDSTVRDTLLVLRGASKGLQLDTLVNATAEQTPTPVPEVVLLYLTLSTAAVNMSLLESMLKDRGIHATVANVTRYADGQYSVVQMQPTFTELSAFLVTACQLRALVNVQHYVVRAAQIASVAVVSSYGRVYPLEGLCAAVPPPNRDNTTDFTLPVDPSHYAVIVLGTLGGLCGFTLVATGVYFLYTYRQEQFKLEPQLDPPALSPLILSPSLQQSEFRSKPSVWSQSAYEVPGTVNYHDEGQQSPGQRSEATQEAH